MYSANYRYFTILTQVSPLLHSIYACAGVRWHHQSPCSDRVKCQIILHIEQNALCMCSKIDIIMLHTDSNCYTYARIQYFLFPSAAPAVPVTDTTVTLVNDTVVRVKWINLTLNDARGFSSYVVSVTGEGKR